ncbi:surface lipoprotein assembly modifier [Cognatiyoonia sp. IB215182]|uniref:surface lipoprotein assembly modifier n=1 Tax=Cognatiyoonia sp. IB215182 TaxID=3097353 RepID=UPI002A13D6A5|nr:surface lipoprotein assembly modifier [Cognatiyoonia sp. IB215182]MDX8351188.1 surface lipoprotein assembly modifier [Cognatiyoonia sp. IB215182]
MRAWIRWVLVALTLWAAPVAAQPVDLSLDDARLLARQAIAAGEFALAAEIARKLIEVNPDDRDAHLFLAVAAPQLGDADAGWEAGAKAWRLSETSAERYEAARVTALAAANGERFTLSTIWLRIALNDTPNEAARTQTLRDARTVARRNPWSTQLTFSIVPSNNINGGADDEEQRINGETDGGTLSEDAVALAGWRTALGVRTQYRFQENSQSRTAIGLQYTANRAHITDDVSVPDEALTSNYAELFLRHDRALENGLITGRLATGTLDYRNYRQSTEDVEFEKYDFVRIGVDRQFPLSDDLTMSLTAQRERLEYSAIGIGRVDRTFLSSTLSYQLDNNDRVSANLSFTNSDGEAESGNFTFDSWTLQASYAWAEPFGPVSLSVNGGLQISDYPKYSVFDAVEGGREDTTVFVGANVGFPEVEYFGFSPGVAITARTADSNISRFERDTFSVGFTLSSVF